MSLEGAKKSIENWLSPNITYNYSLKKTLGNYPYWTIDVDGADVNLVGIKLESLPEYIIFNEIRGGSFICINSSLSSMRGFPKMVGYDLDISYSKIKNLEDAPKIVDRDFVARGLNFSIDQVHEKIKKVTGRIIV